MLKMKKNFIGLALSAAMGLILVGCQTAPKSGLVLTDADDFLNIPGYAANYDRNPAGAGEIAAEVFRVMKALPKEGVIKGVKKDFSIAYLNYVSRAARQSEDATVKRVVAEAAERNKALRAKGKKPKSELSIDDVKKLPEEVQARLSAEFLRSEGLSDLVALNALRNKLDAKIASMGGSDMYRMKGNGLLSQKLETRNINAKINQNADNAGRTVQVSEGAKIINKSFNDLIESQTSSGEKSLMKAEVERGRKLQGRAYRLGGDLNLQPDGCKVFGSEAEAITTMKSYNEMMENVVRDLEGPNGSNLTADGKALRCKNADEIVAYALASYQVKLGRPGPSAIFAVQELCDCKLVSCSAAKKAGEIKDMSRKPACEQ